MMGNKIISRAEAKARGLKRYFTGNPCKHGHVAERLVSSKSCAECQREKDIRFKSSPRGKALKKLSDRRQYEKNKKKYIEKAKIWKGKNKDKVAEGCKKRYDSKKEELYIRKKEGKVLNLEFLLATDKDAYDEAILKMEIQYQKELAARREKRRKLKEQAHDA